MHLFLLFLLSEFKYVSRVTPFCKPVRSLVKVVVPLWSQNGGCSTNKTFRNTGVFNQNSVIRLSIAFSQRIFWNRLAEIVHAKETRSAHSSIFWACEVYAASHQRGLAVVSNCLFGLGVAGVGKMWGWKNDLSRCQKLGWVSVLGITGGCWFLIIIIFNLYIMYRGYGYGYVICMLSKTHVMSE